jgi:ADP-heptose:LPS heptosyltransferase
VLTEWADARRILAVRLDNIGDVIMLGPALRALKDASPAASITLLASPGGALAAPLLPWIDEVISLRAVWQDLGARMAFDPRREERLIATLRAGTFDAALIFTSFSQTPHAPGYACYLAGIPLRAGDGAEFGGSILTTELRSHDVGIHQVERNLRLVEAIGCRVHDRSLRIRIGDEAHLAAERVLADVGVNGPFALLHPGASAPARRYPVERFAEVARHLARRGLAVVVTGTERERAIVDAAAPNVSGVHALVDRTTLPEYAALVERAAVVLCGNTLPLHLADACRTPVVAVYSGTDLESQWRPRDTAAVLLRAETPCHPCYLIECPIGMRCLDIAPAVVAEEVLHAADRGVARAAAG